MSRSFCRCVNMIRGHGTVSLHIGIFYAQSIDQSVPVRQQVCDLMVGFCTIISIGILMNEVLCQGHSVGV